jgi:formamidopyrimidine-DNA glycosylase
MPELPEVETVVRGLQSVLPGTRIVTVRLGKTDFIDDPASVEQFVPGNRVREVRRYGKFVVIGFESPAGSSRNPALLIHLGMTGQLVTCPSEAAVVPHTHVFFSLDNGRELRYTDIRRFGQMRFLSGETELADIEGLGLDPLEASEEQFVAALRGRRARVKALLLDQRVLRGMGNIYTDESLWRARIHPARLATSLKQNELRSLYRTVRAVLTEAIRLRGSSISDYVDSQGERGEFQRRHRAYQREGKKCFRCGNSIRRMIVAGRSSYFCAKCQRPPRKGRSRRDGAK